MEGVGDRLPFIAPGSVPRHVCGECCEEVAPGQRVEYHHPLWPWAGRVAEYDPTAHVLFHTVCAGLRLMYSTEQELRTT